MKKMKIRVDELLDLVKNPENDGRVLKIDDVYIGINEGEIFISNDLDKICNEVKI